MTLEEKVKSVLAEYNWAVITLQTKLEEAKTRIAELENSKEKSEDL